MNVAKQIEQMGLSQIYRNEAKQLRDEQYTKFAKHGTLTDSLKKFLREQSVKDLKEIQTVILEDVNNGRTVKIEGEFEYIARCIHIKTQYTIEHVTQFNDKQHYNSHKFTYKGSPRKNGYVANYVGYIATENLNEATQSAHVFAMTRKAVEIKVLEEINK